MLIGLKLANLADTWNVICKKEDVMTANPLPHRPQERGFTLIELMVVVGIIGLTAAVALPSIAGYVRSNRIRTGQDLVASAFQRARNMAIMRNTQMGVTFITEDNNTFWIHVEDTIAGVTAGNVGFTRQGIDFAAPNAVLSTRFDLPDQVEFAATAADCPGIAGYSADEAAIRFDRYGVASLPAGANALVLDGGSVATPFIYSPAAGDRGVCLIDRQTDLRRWLLIAGGGRVLRVQ
jgi:prepilin-type N-terminal cleavage/methylation domain-containing protein